MLPSETEPTLAERLAEAQRENEALARRLADAEVRSRHVLDVCHEPILLHQNGFIRYTNSPADRLFGYGPGELLGLPFWPTLVHPDDWLLLQDRAARILAGVEVGPSPTWRGLRRDGRPLLIVARGLRVDWEGAPAVLGVYADATERLAAEAALRRSEARLAACVEITPHVAIQWFDASGRLTFWNRASETIFGWTAAEAVGRTLADLMLTPAQMATLLPLLPGLAATGQSLGPTEFLFRRKDGAEGVCLSTVFSLPAPDGGLLFACIDVDLTEQKHSAERLRLALQSARAGVWEWDPATGAVYASDELRAILGLDAGPTAPGLPAWLVHVHPDDRVLASDQSHHDLAAGRELDREYRVVRADGSVRWVRDLARMVPGGQGGAGRVLGLLMDVTERRLADEERRSFDSKLQETQRLESLGVLAGGIAHDFNNLLTTMLGYASLAAGQVPPGSTTSGYLEHIERAARAAADLCQQMLAYAGKGRYVVTPVDMASVVREAAGLLHASLAGGARLTVHTPDGLPSVTADASLLRQVVVNLVLNAVEALPPEGGDVSVALTVTRLGDELRGYLHGAGRPPGDYVTLEVSDTGSGMDDATRARMFEPFFSTRFTGRGLGLAAVSGIVRSHAGALEVCTCLGAGTTVRVYFPPTPAPDPDPAPASGAGATARPTHGRVLVVEDEETVRQTTCQLLRVLGFDAVEARDGLEALDHLREPGRLRLVLLDLTMPRLDGAGVLRATQELPGRPPVILMSGHALREIAPRFTSQGVSGFLQKPFGLSELTAEVSRVLNQRPS